MTEKRMSILEEIKTIDNEVSLLEAKRKRLRSEFEVECKSEWESNPIVPEFFVEALMKIIEFCTSRKLYACTGNGILQISKERVFRNTQEPLPLNALIFFQLFQEITICSTWKKHDYNKEDTEPVRIEAYCGYNTPFLFSFTLSHSEILHGYKMKSKYLRTYNYY